MKEYFNEEKEAKKKNIKQTILKIACYLIVLPFLFVKKVQLYHVTIVVLLLVIYFLAYDNIELNYKDRKNFNDYILKYLKEKR